MHVSSPSSTSLDQIVAKNSKNGCTSFTKSVLPHVPVAYRLMSSGQAWLTVGHLTSQPGLNVPSHPPIHIVTYDEDWQVRGHTSRQTTYNNFGPAGLIFTALLHCVRTPGDKTGHLTRRSARI